MTTGDTSSVRSRGWPVAFLVTSVVVVMALIISMGVWFHRRNGNEVDVPQFAPVSLSTAGSPDAIRARRDVGIQLFQWPWTSIARECRTTLGPMGIRRVLISPPQENLILPTWTSSYAPVSYRLNSKLGTREELAAMVRVCRQHGVDIIADAVMNHMSPAIPPFRGIDGSLFSQYSYPGLYSWKDFHHCTLTPDGVMHTYQDRGQVQQCNALGLPDLDTGSSHVHKVLRAYLRDLLSLGVAGFRVDAAKHISAEDVGNILRAVPDSDFVVQEVIPGFDEPITSQEYFPNGRVFDFTFAGIINDALTYGTLADVFSSGTERGLIPVSYGVPVVTNHDFERDVNLLTYRDGWAYQFAHLVLLATGLGTPFLYSGYAYDQREQPAPSTAAGKVQPVRCAADSLHPVVGEFTCMQRLKAFATMVEWRYRAMSGRMLPPQRHTSDIPLMAPASIVWQAPGVVALTRHGLLFVANWTKRPVSIPLPPGITDMSSLVSLHAGRVDYKRAVLTLAPGDIIVSMRSTN